MAATGDTAGDDVREREQKHFDRLYVADLEELAPDTEETFRPVITPPHEPGGTPGGLVSRRIYDLALAEGVGGRRVLDYACGAGHWGIRLAQLGANVSGFDLSEKGIERANQRARNAQVADTCSFDCADAARLPYPDDTFDLVVGPKALHHTIKYEGTAQELHRIMRPGALAVFAESLEGNVVLKLGRAWTMRHEEDAGDVLLTEPMIRAWAAGFSDVTVERYCLLTMAKRVGRLRPLLPLLQKADDVILGRAPWTSRWCGECAIVLRK